jgi:uncharacterized membrane protein YvbJ
MFCPKCGKELPDDSAFCLKCGHALSGTNGPKSSGSAQGLRWIVLTIALVLSAAIGGIGWVFLSRHGSQASHASDAKTVVQDTFAGAIQTGSPVALEPPKPVTLSTQEIF